MRQKDSERKRKADRDVFVRKKMRRQKCRKPAVCGSMMEGDGGEGFSRRNHFSALGAAKRVRDATTGPGVGLGVRDEVLGGSASQIIMCTKSPRGLVDL